MTDSYSRLPAPAVEGGADPAVAALEWIERWTTSDALRDLLLTFGGPDPRSTAVDLEDLVSFSSRNWDFRRGKERNLADAAEFDPETEAQILSSSEALGLRTPEQPRNHEYDYVLILGGLVRACVVRPSYAAQLLSTGLRVREIAAIGGFRPLRGDEPGLARATGFPDVTNEVGAMEVGLRTAFDLGEPVRVDGSEDEHNPNTSWMVKEYQGAEGVQVHLVAAPSTDPEMRRANTADTYAFWAERLVHLTSHDRVLLITSQIYVPYQGLDAIRMLAMEYGCGVETVGADASFEAFPQLRQTFTPANYLQEVNSTLRSISIARATTGND